ncbi:MAG: hypothetical protein V4619_09185 [Bacteroidota bacterium]
MNDAVKGWAEVAIDKFHQALDDYEIGRLDGALWKSLAYELVQNGGDVEAVIIKFKQYGRFVDMGVGRGVPVGVRGTPAFSKSRKDNGQLHKYGRKAKLWYSKTKYREVAILRQILVASYGKKTLAEFESEFIKTEHVNPL